ncbi:orotidine 5'-phosphate decarboxylase [Methylobacillus sp. MM3]|uniref:orotidine-5'-phosphate decarboxylase n=1 Tax=Methylobacillus sp. MM3 TaxID=1848039 RepID=UPI0007DEAB8E|nr:orotidine-5'-phosphate decarboxylase [Methylobacillus sp. MM3]OAJ70905.1 orotidine 5'-phosphate decarboxylase [Methylobacillus sp. MM3]
MTAQYHDPKIVVALDFAEAKQALAFVDRIDPTLCRVKVGKELFTAEGPRFVEELVKRDFGVFLDLKFHDIPNTVAKACEAAAKLGVWMLNVHASGGRAMMEAARNAIDKSSQQPLLIAVTVLTSMDQAALNEIGISGNLQDQVLRLALLTEQAGLDGVVCSAQEATLLRQHVKQNFCLVTPGIRPAAASKDDQSRIVTPADALQQGSSYLVIGRPITQAVDPLKALHAIIDEI